MCTCMSMSMCMCMSLCMCMSMCMSMSMCMCMCMCVYVYVRMCKATAPGVKQSRASQWRVRTSRRLGASVDMVHRDYA